MSTNPMPDDLLGENAIIYKYQRLRERLRQDIASGELAGRVPGERVLAKRYQANAKTINKALSDLALDGLLVRYVGRGTFVAGSEPPPGESGIRKRTFCWLEPANRANGQGCYQRAAQTMAAQGHRLERIDLPPDATAEVPSSLLRPTQLRGIAGLILFAARPSAELLADLLRRHLPTVIANNRHHSMRTSAVHSDYGHGAFELTQHLVQLGHHRIQLLIDADLLPAAGDARAGYRAAMQRYGHTGREPLDVKNSFEWNSVIDGSDGPTALICVGADLAAQAARQALSAGLNIPAALSIAAIPEPDAPEANQSPTIYQVSANDIVDWAARLILNASPGQHPQMVIIPGQLQIRGSTAPPTTGPLNPLTPPGQVMV
jgi:DNA-binding LacI/PurR family transcriptional regulator